MPRAGPADDRAEAGSEHQAAAANEAGPEHEQAAAAPGAAPELDTATEKLTTTVPAVHGVIDAAKSMDMTSIAEAATV